MENKLEYKKLFQNIFQYSSEGILIMNRNGIILKANQSTEKMFGYDSEELNNKELAVIFPEEFRNYFEIHKNNYLEGINTFSKKMIIGINKSGLRIPIEIRFTTSSFNKDTMLILYINHIKDYNYEVFLKKEFRKILWLIAQHKPINLIGNQLIKTIESLVNKGKGAILILDESTQTLRKLAAPNLPAGFSWHIEEVEIGSEVCCCGMAALEKEEIIIKNIADSSIDDDYKKSALKNNFKSCWSFPILSSTEKVLGTLVIYFEEFAKPKKIEKELISDVIQLMSIAIEQYNTTMILQKNKIQLEKYTHELEGKVNKQTSELNFTIQNLVATNLSLNDQIQITNEAEARRRTSQAMFLAIAKNFPKGIIVVITGNFLVQYIEGEELDMVGLKGKIYPGITLNKIDVFSNDLKNQLKENIIYTLKGEPRSFEIRYENNIYSVNSTPLFDNSTNKTHVLLVFTNITDQKKVQLEVLDNLRKEKELNELKSQFISLASHEFRTPLSVILSSTILIEKQNSPGNEAKREKSLAKIRSNINYLKLILDDFLSLSKLEEGKIQSQPVNFDLIKFSKSLIEEINPYQKNDQTVKIISDLSKLQVYHDPKLIRFILTNLLSNAMKYSSDSEDVSLQVINKGKEVLIEVKDNGVGIPKEDQKNLFKRFYRGTNVAHFQGTGLGLYIVKQYTELAGGTISFKSELSEGTTFSIELPINQLKDEKSFSY